MSQIANERDGWAYVVVPGDAPGGGVGVKLRLIAKGFRALTSKDPERLNGRWPAGTVVYGAGKKAAAKYRKDKDEARAKRRAPIR